MFRSELSGKLSKPGEKAARIVTKVRKREYYEDRKDREGNTTRTLAATGWEIVEEKLILQSEVIKNNKEVENVKTESKTNIRDTSADSNTRKINSPRTGMHLEKGFKKQF